MLKILFCFFFSLFSLLSPISTIKTFAINGSDFSETTNPGGGNGTQYPQPLTAYINSDHEDEFSILTTLTEHPVTDSFSFSSFNFVNWIITRLPVNNSYNSIDDLIFVLRKIEAATDEYYTCSREEKFNYIFSYIRSRDPKYIGDYENYNAIPNDLLWEQIAGPYYPTYNAYINNLSAPLGEISIKEFFYSFAQYDFNGAVPISTSFNKKLLLKDPLNENQQIDLLHLFAAIDGIYHRTQAGTGIVLFENNHQKDLVSWLGDLQTYANEIRNQANQKNLTVSQLNFPRYTPSEGYIDFNEFFNAANPTFSIGSFSNEDLIADIDAMNITKLLLDGEYNLLSDAISAYYNTVKPDNSSYGNRYYQFIYSNTLELENQRGSSILEDFQKEIFSSLNLNYSDGICSNCEYYTNFLLNPHLFFLRQGNESLPATEIRSFAASLFYDYILARSNRFN